MKVFITFGLLMVVEVISLRAEVVYWPLTALDLAKQRATSINCISNLKRIGLAARIWSSEHNGQCPASIQVFTNELDSPSVLFCPANVAHQAVTNWNDVDWSQIDYEWVPQANWNNPDDIICRCRIHDNVVLVDGSPRESGGYRNGWPAIIAPPLTPYAAPGSEVRFEVRIAPNAQAPLSYQWRRQHLYYVTNVTFVEDPENPGAGYWITNRRAQFTVTLLNGETNSSYVIPNAQTNHSDYYSVVVSNAMGAGASSESRLFVDGSVADMATNTYWSAIHCVNNLKQIALFARILANQHDEHMPQSFTEMTNSFGLPIFGWPVVLFCRSDTNRTAPADWNGFDFADTSYELVPGDDQDPLAPFCRCKVHGFYAQMDGNAVYKPHFNRIRQLPDRTRELNFTIFAGQSSVLEASANLVNWVTLSRYTPTNGTFSYNDASDFSARFYRLRTE
jgi:hypothetical protein